MAVDHRLAQSIACEALTILKKLHLLESDTNDLAARAELVQIHAQTEVDKLYGSSWLQIARKKTYLKRFALAAGTAGILQCCGQQVITSYGPSLYGNLGYGPLPQLCFQAGYISTGAVTQILSVLVVDLFSRPKFMATGVFACMGTLVGEAVVVARYVGTDNTNALQAGVAMLFLFLGFYSFFLDGTQFSYIGEIFPTGLRAKGLSVGVATICLVNIIWLQAAPVGLRHICWRFYLVFICTSATGAILMWIFFPDTLGIPLEEMSAIFEGADSVVSPEKALEIAEKMEDVEVAEPQRSEVTAKADV